MRRERPTALEGAGDAVERAGRRALREPRRPLEDRALLLAGERRLHRAPGAPEQRHRGSDRAEGRQEAGEPPDRPPQRVPFGVLGVDLARGQPAQQVGDRVVAPARTGEHPLPVVVVGQRLEGARELERGTGLAAGVRLAGAQELEILDGRRRRCGLRPGGRDVEAAVVVAAAHARLAPGLGVRGLDSVAVGEARDERGRQRVEHRGEELGGARIARAVDQLETAEEQQALLELRDRQPVVDPEERVGEGVREPSFPEPGDQRGEVPAQRLDLPMVGLVDAPDQDVDRRAILEKLCRHFARNEDAGQVGDLERAVDRVVVGEGHEVHPPVARDPVDVVGLGEALRRADPLEVPLAGAVGALAVDVQVAATDHLRPPGRVAPIRVQFRVARRRAGDRAGAPARQRGPGRALSPRGHTGSRRRG